MCNRLLCQIDACCRRICVKLLAAPIRQLDSRYMTSKLSSTTHLISAQYALHLKRCLFFYFYHQYSICTWRWEEYCNCCQPWQSFLEDETRATLIRHFLKMNVRWNKNMRRNKGNRALFLGDETCSILNVFHSQCLEVIYPSASFSFCPFIVSCARISNPSLSPTLGCKVNHHGAVQPVSVPSGESVLCCNAGPRGLSHYVSRNCFSYRVSDCKVALQCYVIDSLLCLLLNFG